MSRWKILGMMLTMYVSPAAASAALRSTLINTLIMSYNVNDSIPTHRKLQYSGRVQQHKQTQQIPEDLLFSKGRRFVGPTHLTKHPNCRGFSAWAAARSRCCHRNSSPHCQELDT